MSDECWMQQWSQCAARAAAHRAGASQWASALGIGHLPGDGGGLRPGWDISPRVGDRISRSCGQAGEGWGELETGTAARWGMG